jgi:predicted HicB family RNase H-like nuclease
MLVLLLYLSLLTSRPADVQEAVDVEVAEFFRQCKARGIEPEYKTFKYSLGRISQTSHYGYSLKDTLGNVSIVFDYGFVKSAINQKDFNAVKFLVFHELGHGLLSKDHVRDRVHIMNDTMFSDRESFRRLNTTKLVNEFFELSTGEK